MNHEIQLPTDCTHFYLDCNPWIRWSEARAGTVRPDAARVGVRLEALLADPALRVACSETTLIEVVDVLSRYARGEDVAYDLPWLEGSKLDLFEFVEQGRLLVLDTPMRLAEPALELIERATVEHGANLRAWDAAHFIHAANWAMDLEQPVSVVTHDSDFATFLGLFPEYTSHVLLCDLHDPMP